MQLAFIDLDGVIIDSLEECFVVSQLASFGEFEITDQLTRQLFVRYRGLVGPAYQYDILMKCIRQFGNEPVDVDLFSKSFYHLDRLIQESEKQKYTEAFFLAREKLMTEDIDKWIGLNPLTAFGRHLRSRQKKTTRILVTTKNKMATQGLIHRHRLEFSSVYAYEDYIVRGSKAKIIYAHLAKFPQHSHCIFIDDHVGHFREVDGEIVRPYFAHWGYGRAGSSYPDFNEAMWKWV